LLAVPTLRSVSWKFRQRSSCHGSKLFGQTRLFQHRISGVPGFDFTVYRKVNFRDWAEPDFMVALALPFKTASCLPQNLFQLCGIDFYQAACR